MHEPTTQPARRPYRLTPSGLRALRASIARVKPWRLTTGPRTAEGKARSRMNAWKHGERSAEMIQNRRAIAATMRLLRGDADGLQTGGSDGA